MKTHYYKSVLATHMQRFIALKQAGGSTYESQMKLLLYFDRFLVKNTYTQPVVSPQCIQHYLASIHHLATRTWYNRFSVVRQFCQYMAVRTKGQEPGTELKI